MQNYGSLIVYLVFFIGLMYFMIIAPQKKREKKTKEMLNTLQVGSNVTTVGGIMGKVINIKDDEVTIESSIEKTQIKVKKWAVKDIEAIIEA